MLAKCVHYRRNWTALWTVWTISNAVCASMYTTKALTHRGLSHAGKIPFLTKKNTVATPFVFIFYHASASHVIMLSPRHCICHTCADDMLKDVAVPALLCPACRVSIPAPHGPAFFPKNFALIPSANVASALLKRPLMQGGAEGGVSPAKRLAPLASPAASAASACAMHPAKSCIYLCMDCRKAVCEICCMSSLSACCKSHEGHLIHDIAEIMAQRQRDEWDK